MIANYHTHTWRCNHASGTEEEYVAHALQRGLKILGFSDHSPYIFPGSYYSGFRMKLEQLDGYIETVLALREKYRGQLEIPLGLELEYYSGLLPQLLEVLRDRPIEYLLLGQHFLGDEMGEPYSGRATADETTLRRYCAQVCDAMQTGLFTYLAHPDLIHFVGDRKTYARHMSQIAREAKSCGIPLELNLLGMKDGRNYPNDAFWELAAQEGCQVVLGCDAHTPHALSDVEPEKKVMEMVRSLGLELVQTVQLRAF